MLAMMAVSEEHRISASLTPYSEKNWDPGSGCGQNLAGHVGEVMAEAVIVSPMCVRDNGLLRPHLISVVRTHDLVVLGVL